MDRLVSMRAFVQVIDSGSFAAAAKVLKASPASVTNHDHALKDHSCDHTPNRPTQKLHLTEVGRNFYEHSSKILMEVEEAERCSAPQRPAPPGLLGVNP